MGLRGAVLNDAEGVLILVAGEGLEAFAAALAAEAPPLARVDAVEPAPHRFPSVDPRRPTLAHRCRRGAITSSEPSSPAI
jgi:hydrogenase maturation factor HypF (carbamoyltransferase family)